MVSLSRETTTVATLVLMFALALSGCIGGNNGNSSSDDAVDPTRASVDENSPFGAITGTVNDDELRAIAQAQVGLRGTEMVTNTDATGYYEFTELQPGTYTVDVAKIGFDPQATQVEVVAGIATPLDFRLVPLEAAGIVYHETTSFTGNYDCALGAGLWVSSCSYPYTAAYLTALGAGANLSSAGLPPDLQKNEFRYNFTVRPGAVQVVSEMEWAPSSAASQRMQIILSCSNYDPVLDDCLDASTYAAAEGESPLRVVWDVKGHVAKPPEWVMARGYLPFIDTNPLNPNLQVALAQRFTIWNTVWYNGPAPEEFSMVEQGS